MIGLDITTTGPLFSGVMAAAADDMLGDVVEAVAEVAKKRQVEIDQASFRNPTPYYWTQVRTSYPAFLTAVVDDNGVIYGRWLEGVSPANARSKFKGYRMWARTFAEVDAKAVQLAAGAVEKFMRRMDFG